jgi:limonene 1,2-monooxygenase
MEFGIFSNGFRARSSATLSYEEDLHEIVLADQLGFRDAYISEHHGERPYIGRVDTIPVPDMLICKAAGLTRRIRMGSAVKLIHLQHPLDVAIQAAVADHLLPGRYIFGFGTGFASPLFSEERGLAFEDRHARLMESFEAIQKCWSSDEPFDLDGRFWQGRGLIALPKPRDPAGPAMATATDSEPMIRLAAERGYTLLAAHVDTPARIRARTEKYMRFAAAAGRPASAANVTAARLVYIADSRAQALEDLRPAVTFEISVQAERGFLGHLKRTFGIDVPNDEHALEALVETGTYIIGDADEVAAQLERFHEECGGFGTLLIVAGKSWATREKRDRSMRSFMRDVAPRLRRLDMPVADAV